MTIGNKKGKYIVWSINKETGEIRRMGRFSTQAEAETYQGLIQVDDYEDEWEGYSGNLKDYKKFIKSKRKNKK